MRFRKSETRAPQSRGASRTAGADRTRPPRRLTSSASSVPIRASRSATRTPQRPSRLGGDTDDDVLLGASGGPLVDVRDDLLENAGQITARHILQNFRAGLCVRA